MVYSWCPHGVLLVYSWCTRGVLMVHSWCTPGVLLVYWWCTPGVHNHIGSRWSLEPATLNRFLDQGASLLAIRLLWWTHGVLLVYSSHSWCTPGVLGGGSTPKNPNPKWDFKLFLGFLGFLGFFKKKVWKVLISTFLII